MLTSSSNQYLRPEYLTPLPTTLDAKKSPLALLAQTCSQIGADPLPTGSSGSLKSSSSLLSSSSSGHEVSGGGTSNSVGSSSTPLSSASLPSSGSNSSSSNSSNCSGGGQGGGGNGSKKSKSSHHHHHHHLNVGTEHPPSHHGSTHRTSNSSTSISGEGVGGGGKKSGKSSGKNHHTLSMQQAHHQSHGTMEKTGGEKDLTSVRLTPPLIIGNNSNSSSGSSNGSGRGKSATPDEKSRVKTPSSTAVDKSTSGSPSLSSMASGTRDSVGREAANKSPAVSNMAPATVMLPGSGNTIPGSSSTTTSTSSSSSSNSSTGGATAESVSSKSSHDNHSIPLPSPIFTSTPLSNGTNSTTPSSSSSASKLNLNGPLGSLTSAELFSLSSLKSHGNHLPFPSLYPGLSSHSVGGGGAGSTTAGLPPYLHSYARLKAAAAANGVSGADHLGGCGSNGSGAKGGPGTCRDPFCTGCQLGTPHLPSGLSHKSCPAGCMQCDHHSPFFNGCAAGGGGSSGAFPFLPRVPIPPSFYPSALANSSAAAAAAAASAASSQPYVCNWIVGETYCGKRFSSSDELLQHLRSHTSLSSAAAAAGQSSDPLTSYAHNPFLSIMSMNLNLSRSYPSPSLSPLSSARFHPYSKMSSLGGLGTPPGLGSMPGGPAEVAAAAAAAGLSSFPTPPGGFSSLSHPLNPYFSYAAFYGPR